MVPRDSSGQWGRRALTVVLSSKAAGRGGRGESLKVVLDSNAADSGDSGCCVCASLSYWMDFTHGPNIGFTVRLFCLRVQTNEANT